MRCFYLLAILTAAAALSGCNAGSASISRNGRPSVLHFCSTISSLDPDTGRRRHELTIHYLEKALHMRVEGVETTNYGGAIEAFRAHKIDVASISPFSYVLASQKTPLEAIAMRSGPDGGPATYSGSLAVPGNSPIHTIQDLVKHAHELRISFVDPASASGFLVQNAYLQSLGVEPQRDFKKVVFSMNHPASILTLKAGKVDVAACMERLIQAYSKSGKLAPGDVRIIWTSPSIPNQPIAVRKDLPRPFIEEIRRAFLEMKDKDPEAFAAQVPKAYAGIVGPRSVYVPADDSMFDGLREMARHVPNLSLLDR